MDVDERNGEVVFLRKLREGAAAESYGLHVAALAGLPGAVLRRAGEIMGSLKGSPPENKQISTRAGLSNPVHTGKEKLSSAEHKILESLSELEINELSPLEALNLIHRWKKLTQSRESGGQENTRKAKNHPAQGEPSLFD